MRRFYLRQWFLLLEISYLGLQYYFKLSQLEDGLYKQGGALHLLVGAPPIIPGPSILALAAVAAHAFVKYQMIRKNIDAFSTKR